MAGKSPVVADEDQRRALAGLARPRDRGEADRARAILLTQGSSVLLQTLLAHDLIDEFRLLVFPLVLGPGKRLFGQGTKPGAVKLAATTVSTTGVIMSVYDRAGAISTGSFELVLQPEMRVAPVRG